MDLKVFLNVLISLLAVFIIFNLVIPFSTQEGFTEDLRPKSNRKVKEDKPQF